MTQTENKKKSVWTWGIDDEELENQVENYNNLKISESYRGISVLIVAVLLGFSLLLGFFGVYASVEEILYGLIIYIPILFFVYKGHRWAIVALMILWTFEKGYQLIEVGGIMPLIWWAIIIPYFYKALRVENERRKLAPALRNTSGVAFCHKCGESLESNSKFCSRCGAKAILPAE